MILLNARHKTQRPRTELGEHLSIPQTAKRRETVRHRSQPISSIFTINHDFSESLILCTLALTGNNEPDCPAPPFPPPLAPCPGFPCQIFATVYTSPLMKPTAIAPTLPTVTGASKNTSPEMASGSLLSAPTMEYVVEDVIRTHQAEV